MARVGPQRHRGGGRGSAQQISDSWTYSMPNISMHACVSRTYNSCVSHDDIELIYTDFYRRVSTIIDYYRLQQC